MNEAISATVKIFVCFHKQSNLDILFIVAMTFRNLQLKRRNVR